MNNRKLIVCFLLLLLSTQNISAQEVSRMEIQNYFEQTPGNASYLPFWETKYLNKKVTWTGKIFSIEYQKDFNRTEVTLKVLPYTKMYDTIVYLPGDITDKYHENDDVSFTGTITRGVDMLGVKDVQVSIGKNVCDKFGDYTFTETGIVNVNLIK